MTFKRAMGMLLGFALAVGFTSGCKSSSPTYEGSSVADFKEYRDTRPVPKACDKGECTACKPEGRDAAKAILSGDVKVDTLANGVSDLYSSSVHKLDSYIDAAGNSRTWAAYSNDVDACQAGKETEEEKQGCHQEVFDKLSDEDKKDVVAFHDANQASANANLRALAGLAKVSLAVTALAAEYKEKDWGLKDAAKASLVGQSMAGMGERVKFMTATQRFHKQEKARMDYLKQHTGR
ncbi:MAG: hypothetical protein O6952_03740 [Planctomycetota bacterium]|nr:hypothetical protein [Planctomycetota bacterium]